MTDKISNKIIADHNLSEDEYNLILKILGRVPNLLELGIFSVMWSEHCSYKSTKKWLKTLPTKNNKVICGPGENAGIVDIGDNDAIVFKMESHNHPSFIEPYQGAATGVGGIMRDIFTMGARPIANLNSLRFGDPKNKKTKNLLRGVVQGIGDYGNCVGIPTVGGECFFHKSYNNNILVNAMCVGLVKKKKFSTLLQVEKEIQLYMLVQKLGETEYTVQLWHQQSLTKIQKVKDLKYKLVTLLLKNFF